MGEIIRKLCKYKKIEIVAGAVCADHVHLCMSISPKLSISDFVDYLIFVVYICIQKFKAL